jgi:hypothetical protein
MTSFARLPTSAIPSSRFWRHRRLSFCASTHSVMPLGLRVTYSKGVPLSSSSSSPCARQTHCPAPFPLRRRAAPALPPPSVRPPGTGTREHQVDEDGAEQDRGIAQVERPVGDRRLCGRDHGGGARVQAERDQRSLKSFSSGPRASRSLTTHDPSVRFADTSPASLGRNYQS